MTISLRKARPGDRKTVIRLLENAKMNYRQDIFPEQKFNETLKDFGKYCIVAQDGSKVIGYVFGYDDSGRSGKAKYYGYMGRLVVDPEYRRKGVAERLMRAGLAEFKKAGCRVVFAGVHRRNKASLSLVRKLGFDGGDYVMMWHL